MPRNNKRKKTAKDLFEHLRTGPFDLNRGLGQVDWDAVVEEVRQNPKAAAKQYLFDAAIFVDIDKSYCCYPLHQAVWLGAPLSVIKVIYNSYPPAVKKRLLWTEFGIGDENGHTVLHLALLNNATVELVSFLLDCWPDAIRTKNRVGDTPLQVACNHCVPLEVMSVLVEKYPEAIREENDGWRTPVDSCYDLCYTDGLELLGCVDVILNITEIDEETSKYIIDYFIEIKWIGGVELMFDRHPSTAYDLDIDDNDLPQFFSMVARRRTIDEIDKDAYTKMMDYFVSIKWINGVALIFDRCPSVAYEMDFDTKTLPPFLSMVARRCRMKTMWSVVSNIPEMMEGI